MSLNQTVSAERIHISFFGMRNAGKSSIVNAITGQSLSVVSDVKGTTTDPVKKAMELLPLGPVVITDTPGIDDEGVLGEKRVEKTREILAKTDIAVLVADAVKGLSSADNALLKEFEERKLPFLIVFNKCDLLESVPETEGNTVYASAKNGTNITLVKEKLGEFAKSVKTEKFIVADLIKEDDLVILVTPIDESAPKGRLILPQQLTLREILDKRAIAITCQDTQLKKTLESLSHKPALVITDSQVFGKVSPIVPEDIPLTSFSVLMARYKGELGSLTKGSEKLKSLKDGDKVLISEGCTHHRQCNDIGTVKIPQWIRDYSGAEPEFSFTSGGEFPKDLSGYALIVHCGGCMLTEKEMQNRISQANAQSIPIVNYGMAIATMNGILERSLEIFK